MNSTNLPCLTTVCQATHPILGILDGVYVMFRVCHAILSVSCSPVVTCWERANLLALLCLVFFCVFVTFPCGILGQVWYLNL